VTTQDNKFVALGPVVVGFGTSATRIQRGVDVAGTKIGVVGSGPVGIEGHGEIAGVRGFGQVNGRGGEFNSQALNPQINLNPHVMRRRPGPTVVATPFQFSKPEDELPSKGKLGDLWTSFTDAADPLPNPIPEGFKPGPQPECHLWLCVRASRGSRKALWGQVLLGSPVEGRHPPSFDL
jgi:hypothetical protein